MNTNNQYTAEEVADELKRLSDSNRAKASQRFFKTGKGQYGEGDIFIGVSVPVQRTIAKKFSSLALPEVCSLLKKPVHEMRLTALIIMTEQYKRANESDKNSLYNAYLSHTEYINNWDLVDTSAHKIVGPHLDDNPNKMQILKKYAQSPNLWERRIAMVSTLYNSGVQHSSTETIEIVKILLHDSEDLIQKAAGWTLREVGKQVSVDDLTQFLDRYAHVMPRTMLRYSIERLEPAMKKHYMELKNT